MKIILKCVKKISKVKDKEWIEIYKHGLNYYKAVQPILVNTLNDCNKYLNGSQKDKQKVRK